MFVRPRLENYDNFDFLSQEYTCTRTVATQIQTGFKDGMSVIRGEIEKARLYSLVVQANPNSSFVHHNLQTAQHIADTVKSFWFYPEWWNHKEMYFIYNVIVTMSVLVKSYFL